MPSFHVHHEVTEELVENLWSKLPHAGDFWGFYAGTDLEGFTRLLVTTPVLVETAWGLLRIGLFDHDRAMIHAVFWSFRALRDLETFHAIEAWLKKHMGVKTIFIDIPKESKPLRKLLDSLGFSLIWTDPHGGSIPSGCYCTAKYAKLL